MAMLVLLLILGIAIFLVPSLLGRAAVAAGPIRQHWFQTARLAAFAILGPLFLVTAFFSTYTQIENGNVGVVYQFGRIVGQLPAGAHFIAPWSEVKSVDVQVQRARFHNPTKKTDGADEKLNVDVYGTIDAASHETQNVYFDVTLNWQITADQVQPLFQKVGPDFFARLVPSRVNQFFKAETVKYEATEATQKREQIRADVTQALGQELAQYGITVVSIQIDSIAYDSGFTKAIENKQVATQNAQAAQNEVAIAQANAAKAVADAKGKADAAIEAARGDAQSTLVRAQAQADANRQLSASLTPALIQSQAIQKWTGNMPAVLPNGGGVIIDPSSLFARP